MVSYSLFENVAEIPQNVILNVILKVVTFQVKINVSQQQVFFKSKKTDSKVDLYWSSK